MNIPISPTATKVSEKVDEIRKGELKFCLNCKQNVHPAQRKLLIEIICVIVGLVTLPLGLLLFWYAHKIFTDANRCPLCKGENYKKEV